MQRCEEHMHMHDSVSACSAAGELRHGPFEQVLSVAHAQDTSCLSIIEQQDLGSFPHWTMDARIICPRAAEAPCAIVGLSDDSFSAFSLHAAGASSGRQLQPFWTARCTQQLLLYSQALHVQHKVPLQPLLSPGHATHTLCDPPSLLMHRDKFDMALLCRMLRMWRCGWRPAQCSWTS
jgi:hypothetical protein